MTLRRAIKLGLAGVGLIGACVAYWIFGGASYFAATPCFTEAFSPMDGNLRLGAWNVSGQPMAIAVQLDDKLKLITTLPSNRWQWQEYHVAAGFSVEQGRHVLVIRVAGAGVVGRREFAQHEGETNFISIAIFKPATDPQRIDCMINIKTNILGAL